MVGHETFRALFDRVHSAVGENAAIRLVIDYFDIPEASILDVRFDQTLAKTWEWRGVGRGGPGTLTFGPELFNHTVEDIVHSVAGAYEDARLTVFSGRMSSNVREFLAKKVEILSQMATGRRMWEEHFGGRADGFVQDAWKGLQSFKAMTPEEQVKHWEVFEEVRAEVRKRFQAASPSEAAGSADVLREYEAITKPTPSAP